MINYSIPFVQKEKLLKYAKNGEKRRRRRERDEKSVKLKF